MHLEPVNVISFGKSVFVDLIMQKIFKRRSSKINRVGPNSNDTTLYKTEEEKTDIQKRR